MTELFRRIHFLLNRRKLEQELADEMEFHRESSIRNGGAPERFGNSLRLQEESRDAWGWTWVDRLIQDVRYAFRTMRRSPGFTAAAIVTLAIGIGANVAAFGFFNVVMFRPLPIREPDTLLRFHRQAPGQYSSDVPYPMMEFYRRHSSTLSSVLALDFGALSSQGAEKPVRAFFVTSNFFRELGGQAALGRLLDEQRDDAADAEEVAVLAYDYWQSHFGGDPGVAGRTMRLNGKTVTVVGVVARNFSGLTYSAPDVWMPITHQPRIVQGSQLLTNYSADADGVDMWGRLRPGASPKDAEQELGVLTAELRKQRPTDIWDKESLSIEPGGYAQNAGGKSRGVAPPPPFRSKIYPILALIGTLTLLILAVTCGNLGSMLLSRGVARQREIGIRTAVGAGKGRLVRQLLTESLVLALAGAAAALVLGTIVLDRILIWSEGPKWLDVSPDWRVVGFTLGMAFVASILFGLTPALQIVKTSKRVGVARQFLIGSQVAASCVLLITAALLVRAIDHAMSDDPGFEYKHVIAIDPRLAMHGFTAANARGYIEGLQGQLRALPGVESVALSTTPPLGNRTSTIGGEKDGRSFPIHFNHVDPEFFATMRIPLLRGRNLHRGETKAVVVSESLARRMWPGEDPLSKYFEVGPDKHAVVGVVGSARANALADDEAVEIYNAIAEQELPSAVMLVRVRGPVQDSLFGVAETARQRDRSVVPAIETLNNAFIRKIDGTERSATAVAVMGCIALLLSCLGIAGVVSYAVSQRVKEIGLRMALGAMPNHVLGVILAQFWRPLAGGLVVGTMATAGLTQMLRGQLYGVRYLDPPAYAAAVAFLALTAFLAVMIPARRALRIDPMRALRCD